jgi:hypothetical protein
MHHPELCVKICAFPGKKKASQANIPRKGDLMTEVRATIFFVVMIASGSGVRGVTADSLMTDKHWTTLAADANCEASTLMCCPLTFWLPFEASTGPFHQQNTSQSSLRSKQNHPSS